MGAKTQSAVTAPAKSRDQARPAALTLRQNRGLPPESHSRGSSTDLRRPCGPSALLPPVLLPAPISDNFRRGARPRLAAGHLVTESLAEAPGRGSHRSASGTGFRGSGPMYSDWGLMRRLCEPCSSTCADQPATRATHKVGGKNSVGRPIACSTPAE